MARLKKNILIIEDDIELATLLNELLKDEGHQVTLIKEIRELPAAIRAINYQLIISDIQLQDSLGLDLLKILKIKNLQIPVIFMTGYDQADLSDTVNDPTVLEILIKPFKNSDLLNLVNRV